MKKTKDTILSFNVIYKKDPEGGYVSFVPSLPGCHSQGDTLEESENNIKEAIELYLESVGAKDSALLRETPMLTGTIQVSLPFAV